MRGQARMGQLWWVVVTIRVIKRKEVTISVSGIDCFSWLMNYLQLLLLAHLHY